MRHRCPRTARSSCAHLARPTGWRGFGSVSRSRRRTSPNPCGRALGPWPVSGPAIAIGAQRARRFGLAGGDARAPWRATQRGSTLSCSAPAGESSAELASSDWPRMPTRAPLLNVFSSPESSPALSRTLRIGCDSGFRATRTHGKGSPRPCEGKPNRSANRPACLPTRAA